MNEREHLEWLAGGIRSSINKSEIGCFHSLEFFMIYPVIHNFYLDKNEDLWKDFKKALQEHELLVEGEECYRQLDRPHMVEDGYWWFDPKHWK